MIGPFGETLVMDWGVAKLIGRREGEESGSGERGPTDWGEGDSRPQLAKGSATLPGQAVGTPAYMSPEQAAGRLDAAGSSQRRLQSGRDALRAPRRPRAVPGECERGTGDGPGGPVRAAAATQAAGTGGLERDLPAGDGAGALQSGISRL